MPTQVPLDQQRAARDLAALLQGGRPAPYGQLEGWTETADPEFLFDDWRGGPGSLVLGGVWPSYDLDIRTRLQTRVRRIVYSTGVIADAPYTVTFEPTLAPILDLAGEFRALVDEWRTDTLMWASPKRRFLHRAYQRIIGLGPRAAHLILAELRDHPDDWFWALTAITGEDRAGGEPDFERARSAWLEWGTARGLI